MPAPSPVTAASGEGELWPSKTPWRDVRWSVVYVAFLWYLTAVTTFRLPWANVAMAIAIVAVLTRGSVPRFSALLGWLGVFIAWAAVAYPVTRYPEQVREGLIEFGKVWLIVLVALNALRTRGEIRLFIIVFLAGFALYPLRGAFLNYFGGYSLSGRAIWNVTYSNPNDLAALALLHLSMAASLLVTEWRKSWTWVAAAIGVVLVPILILMTQSRGGVIALGVFTILALIAHPKRLRMLPVVAALAIVVVTVAPMGVWTRVGGLSKATNVEHLEQVDPEGSARGRFQIWRVATKIIGDHPGLGVGLGAYPQAHAAYALDEEFDRTVTGRRDTHSTWLNVLAETGVPGLLIFLALLFATFWKAERIRRVCRVRLPRASRQLLYLEFGLLAFLAAGTFGSFAHVMFLYLHVTLIWALAEACEYEATQVRAAGPRVERIR
jgi:O-antigen ligase